MAILSQLFLFFTGIIIAKSLGVEGRGDLGLVVIIVSIIMTLCLFGVPRIMTFHLGKKNLTKYLFIKSYLLFPAVQILIAIAIFFTINYLKIFSLEFIDTLMYISIIIFFVGNMSFNYVSSIFNSSNNLIDLHILNFSYPFIYAFFILLLTVFYNLNLANIFFIWSISAIITIILAKKKIMKFVANLDFPKQTNVTLGKIFQQSLHAFISSINIYETFKIDQILIYILLGTYNLGLFIVANSFSNIFIIFGKYLMNISFHDITVQLTAEKKVKKFIIHFFRYLFLLACMLIPLLFFSPMLINYIFGGEFYESSTIVRYTCLISFLLSAKNYLNDGLKALGMFYQISMAEVFFICSILIFIIFFKPYNMLEVFNLISISLFLSIFYLILIFFKYLSENNLKVNYLILFALGVFKRQFFGFFNR